MSCFLGCCPSPKPVHVRVVAVITIISHLFHGTQFRYSAAFNSLKHVNTTLDPAIAIVYALLHELEPKLSLERDRWRFINCPLAKPTPLTVTRLPADPVHQLVRLA